MNEYMFSGSVNGDIDDDDMPSPSRAGIPTPQRKSVFYQDTHIKQLFSSLRL